MTAENAGWRLHTRCERETLSRFPRTGAILFTIRTHLRKLDHHASHPTRVRGGAACSLALLSKVASRPRTVCTRGQERPAQVSSEQTGAGC